MEEKEEIVGKTWREVKRISCRGPLLQSGVTGN